MLGLAVQAAIEATTPIGELSGATGTHAFGPSPWTAAATTGAKPPIANPICVPIVMRDEPAPEAGAKNAMTWGEGGQPRFRASRRVFWPMSLRAGLARLASAAASAAMCAAPAFSAALSTAR